MGEYEDRYPDAYGRGDEAGAGGQDAQNPQPIEAIPETPRSERATLGNRVRLGNVPQRSTLEHARNEAASAGEPAPQPMRIIEPTVQPAAADYRGIGPRGYARSPARIYEDVCDRLTDDPQIDASDIEVAISGVEITLAGSVDSAGTAARVEALAAGVPGVKGIRNGLAVRERAADR